MTASFSCYSLPASDAPRAAFAAAKAAAIADAIAAAGIVNPSAKFTACVDFTFAVCRGAAVSIATAAAEAVATHADIA